MATSGRMRLLQIGMKKIYILAAYLTIYLNYEETDSSIFFKRRVFY